MDGMRSCPSYEAGFDACDPLGSVYQWSGRGPARVIRRRCRSEGVDRSPYEDVNRDLHCFVESTRQTYHPLPNKSHFTINNGLELRLDRYQHECLLPAAENGDYVMAHDNNGYPGYKQGRSKYYRASPTRPLTITTIPNVKVEDNRLPKVEELLEKVDHEMFDVASVKQPLKSILNNPLPSPPHGILKKPKCKPYQESKSNMEGRRRQRASSESDNTYCNYHLGAPIPEYDRHCFQTNNMKRVKDNSGSYSYGPPVMAPRGHSPSKKQNHVNNTRCTFKDQTIKNSQEEVCKMHLLRTTAINSETVDDIPVIITPHKDIHPLPRPIVTVVPNEVVAPAPAPAPPAAPPAKAHVKSKKKTKTKNVVKMKMKVDKHAMEGDVDDYHSRSPSPDTVPANWKMETDLLEVHLEKPPPPVVPVETKNEVDHNSVTKLTNKMNGAVVSPKKNVKKEVSMEHDMITALYTTNPLRVLTTRKDSPLNLPESYSHCLRQSLFPRVPPYLKFVSHDDNAPLKVPAAIQKHLKWKLTTITPIVVKKTLTNSGFRLVKSECDTAECPQEETIDWIGIWGKHMKSLMFRAIKDGQKMNHFPGTFQIGRKDRLWRNLQKLCTKFGVNEFGIMPKTYVLPHDLKILKHEWEKYAANNERWIIKPPASARGTGIKVVSRWTQIPKKRPVVVQRYVSKPYLINGSKFDLRLYVLLTAVHPLRIYLYRDGLARFASVKYTDELTSLNDRYMHLTNYSINRLSKNYTPNEDFAACEGHKWTLQTLFQYLKTEQKVDIDALWESIKELVIKTIISGEASISALTKANVGSRYNCYELFGIDVLLDEDLKPWLLEVNISPSLHSASPLDIHVKGPMVSEVLNIAQFQVPSKTNIDVLTKEKPTKLEGLPYDSRLYTVYLSKEERDKHIIYNNMDDRDTYLRDILSTLTPDDVRHLVQAEDELTQADAMERVFPTRDTHTYLRYLSGPRYYNRLLDAWEARYSNDRQAGIELLRRLCGTGYHLETPPVPLKNDVDAPTPPASEKPSVSSIASTATISATNTTAGSTTSTTVTGAVTNPAVASAAAHVCGDSLAGPPPAPPPLEPRA